VEVSAGDRPGGATLLTTGATLGLAMERQAATRGERPAVRSMPLWSMSAKSAQPDQVQAHESITTLEDHLRDAGFGSWLMEAISDHPELLSRLKSQALDSRVCGTVGSQATLNAYGGLTA
jgi:transketolase